ncbi:MAG: hypothetical protein GTN64_08165, partial [Candidatus Latescibacteria bacterium]|nr:hypothetical protein [Candidatus Latescibacterota bacterium]NIO78576.1 hypothetical protein [Candidatus Latescibacterota bacterium]
HNSLQELPYDIERLKNLKILILHKNKLAKDETKRIKKLLPDSFVHFKNSWYVYRD